MRTLTYEEGKIIAKAYNRINMLSSFNHVVFRDSTKEFAISSLNIFQDGKTASLEKIISSVTQNLKHIEDYYKALAEYAKTTRRGQAGYDRMIKNVEILRKAVTKAQFNTLKETK